MQKVFSLDPSSYSDVVSLQSLLSDGYEVKFATASHVSINGRANSYSTDSKEGKIVYILEKPEIIKNPYESPEPSEEAKTSENIYEIKFYQKILISSKDQNAFIIHKGENGCENIKVGDKVIIDGDELTVKEIENFYKSFGIMGDNIAVVVE